MLIYLLRHGLTQENLEKRYQGRRDVPLCPQGLAQLRRADFAPKTVMITSLQRTRQTAEVLFPDAELVVADGLKEMDFGVFEGRNYREMEHDPQYRAWVETGCEGRCPGGESKAEFCQRICRAGGCRFGGGGTAAGDRCPRRHPDGGAGTVRRAP
jgi:alpha-ribazole phosphatase